MSITSRNSARYGVKSSHSLKLVLVLAGVFTYPALSLADCRQEESQIMAELNQLASQLNSAGDGICNMVRRAIPVYQRGSNFYANCPAADPTGQQREALEAAVQSMMQTAQQVCT